MGPIAYFNRWFSTPIDVAENACVEDVLRALHAHPMAADQTAQNYVMPPRRYREKDGRFRVYGENQDTWHCFIRPGDERETDPPVYFETCLDLVLDHEYQPDEVIDGDHVLVTGRFSNFVWHAVGDYLCLRLQRPPALAPDVCGVSFGAGGYVELGQEFRLPLGREFPAGYTARFTDDIVCIADWGAAFLDSAARDRFVERYSPPLDQGW